MYDLLWAPVPSQTALNVHKATGITHHERGGLGGVQVLDLALEHFGGEFGVFYREDASKAAAILGFRQFPNLSSADPGQERAWLPIDPEAAVQVTRGMVGEQRHPNGRCSL